MSAQPVFTIIATLSLLLSGALPGIGSASAAGMETATETLGISGSLRGSWWSAAKTPGKDSDAASAALWLKMAPPLGSERMKLYFEGWGRNDSLFRGGKTKGDMTEGYVDATFDPFDLRIGRQVIAWGKADAVNPTDNLSARDYTLLTPEDHDQRTGTGAVKASLNLDSYRLTAIWLPEFRPHTLPLPKTPGISFSEEMPSGAANQWAAKLEYYGSDHDWSLSYFDGYDRTPDLSLTGAGAAGLAVGMRYGRLKAFGADGAVNFDRFGLRAEAAYLDTEDADGTDPFVKNPVFYAVAGGDRTFFDNLNINAQFVYRSVTRFTDADSYADPAVAAIAYQEQLANNQHDAAQQGMTMRINDKWFNDTLEAEVSGLIWFKRGDYIVRPRIKYAVSDTLSVTVGGDIYDGPAESFFGRLKDATAFFTEVRYGI